MSDSLSIESIVEQSLQVAAWMLSQLSQAREAADQVIWESSPWWFRIVIVAVAINGAYLVVRRWFRALVK